MKYPELNELLSNFIAGGVSAGQMYWIPVEGVLIPLSYDELVQLANTLFRFRLLTEIRSETSL